MEMGSTIRHGRLLGLLENSILELFFAKKLEHFSESASLVYWGKKKVPKSCELVDISAISDIEDFTKSTINMLGLVTPDYMHFNSNKFIVNDNETIIAGFPNLIVEIWSKSNVDFDRDFLKYLYSTSDTTEHWYIDQDSNIVECWHGTERIKDQNLAHILRTQDNVEFDLRYLAL